MPWIYLCRDRGGSWAVLRHEPVPEVTTDELELRLLGIYDRQKDGLAAVVEVNRRLAEQRERGRWCGRSKRTTSSC